MEEELQIKKTLIDCDDDSIFFGGGATEFEKNSLKFERNKKHQFLNFAILGSSWNCSSTENLESHAWNMDHEVALLSE